MSSDATNSPPAWLELRHLELRRPVCRDAHCLLARAPAFRPVGIDAVKARRQLLVGVADVAQQALGVDTQGVRELAQVAAQRLALVQNLARDHACLDDQPAGAVLRALALELCLLSGVATQLLGIGGRLRAHELGLVVGGLHAYRRRAFGFGDALLGALLGDRAQLLGSPFGCLDDPGHVAGCAIELRGRRLF
ncbi:MAG: hypothetical protein QOD83_4520 [Solirubrobacteraceae bacterium]|nr:hypothetical protein [Solirubrobacteraceae bacterium]